MKKAKRKGWMAATMALSIVLGMGMNGNAADVADDYVLVEGGAYVMGSPKAEPEREADEVQHEVTVDSFYLSKHEVTQVAYSVLMGSNPSLHAGDDLPVENVTWLDAVAYCNALSLEEGLAPCYTIDGSSITWDKSANGYRLPTEAEWEYACRAGTETPFGFGAYVEDADANCYNAYGYNNDASGSWVNGYLQRTTAVQSYGANGLGIYDMHGNVAEWVWDWYAEYDEDMVINSTGPETGQYKVARGGGWNDFPKHVRSAYRSAFPADVPLYSIGIRLARNAEPSVGTAISESPGHAVATGGKVLIAYFSQTGNTDGLASIIGEMTGADMFRIERETPYAATHNSTGLYAEALEECRANASPPLRAYLADAGLDIDQYDTILLGYCNWWATIPAPVRSFLEAYDMSGKTIIPFCSQGGGRFGQTISAVAKLAPDSAIRAGLWVTYASYPEVDIEDWLGHSGIIEDTSLPMIDIQVGDDTLTATLVDNTSTEALLALLSEGPVTIDMHDYASMEKVGPLPQSLPQNDEPIQAEAGDLILYQGSSFVIYYDVNSWTFTRLGKINDRNQQELMDILGGGDVTAVLSLHDQ